MSDAELKSDFQISQLGVSYGSLQSHIREKTGMSLKRKDISNAVHKVKQLERGGRSVEEETWAVLNNMVSKDAKSQYSVVCDQEHNVSHIFFQTASMRNYLKAYPSVVMVDGTYCINNLGYPLYIFMVVDSDNCGHAVAYALTKNETASTLQDVVQQFVTLNSIVSTRMKTFIVDKDQAEISALQNVMPDIKILLCRFHVAKNFHDCLPKYTKGLDESSKHEAKSLLMKLLYTDSKSTFNIALENLPSDLKAYVLKNWIPCKTFWAQHCTKSFITWGNFTNNCLERHNRKLKTINDDHKSLPELLRAILKLHENEDVSFLQNYKSMRLKSRVLRCNRGPTALIKQLEKQSSILSFTACSMLKSQIEKMPEESQLSVMGSHLNVKRSDKTEEVYDVTNGCRCLFFCHTGLPCWHLMYHRHISNLEVFQDIPDHWLRSTMAGIIDPFDEEPGSSQVEIIERKQKSKKMNETEKRCMATDHWKEVLEGMVSCSHEKFLERCEVLKYIRDSWRAGKDILSIDVGYDDDNSEVNDDVSAGNALNSDAGVNDCAGGDRSENGDIHKCVRGDEIEDTDVNECVGDDRIEDTDVGLNVCFGGDRFENAGVDGYVGGDRFEGGDVNISVGGGDRIEDEDVSDCTGGGGYEDAYVNNCDGSGGIRDAGANDCAVGSCDDSVLTVKERLRLKLTGGRVAVNNTTTESATLSSLKFANEVKKRGRPKESGQTSNKRCKIDSSKKRGKKGIKEEEKQEAEPQVRETSDICPVCKSNNDSLFTGWIKCDSCSQWFHQICIFGSSKVTKAMKYVCV